MHRKARWLNIRFISALFGLAKCSECGCYNEYTPFCPACGASMKGENEHDTH